MIALMAMSDHLAGWKKRKRQISNSTPPALSTKITRGRSPVIRFIVWQKATSLVSAGGGFWQCGWKDEAERKRT